MVSIEIYKIKNRTLKSQKISKNNEQPNGERKGNPSSGERKRNDSIDDLVENIKKHGLSNPFTVYQNSEDYFEILDNQRCFDAFCILNEKNPEQGFNKIDTITFDNIKDISFVVISRQLPMTSNNVIQAVIDLYTDVSSVKLVAEKFGLTEAYVKKIIRNAYPEKLLTIVQKVSG